MASYYGYKDREGTNQVDFSKVSKGIKKEADHLIKTRQDKKDALEKNYQDFKTSIRENTPMGSHKGTNEAMSNFASDAAARALDMKRAMEAGDVKPADNTAFMTNLKGDTEQMFELGKFFNENRDDILARHQGPDGLGSAEELANMELAELLNGKGEPFIGDDGTVWLGYRDPDNIVDGVAQLNTDNPISLSQARSMATGMIDKFDIIATSKNRADNLDTEWKEAIRRGAVKTRDDVRNNPNFNNALEAMVDADLSTPSALLSVLVDGGVPIKDSKGVTHIFEYDIKGDKGDGKNIIKAKYDEASGRYTPDLTPQQMELAKDVYMDTILGQVGMEEEAIEKTQEWELERGDDKKKFRSAVGMASNLYSGDADEIMSAREYFLGLNDKIKDITRTTEGVNVTYLTDNGSTISNNISFKGESGEWKSEADFIRSLTELTGEGDLDDAIARAGIRGTSPTQHSSTEGASRQVTSEIVLDTEYGEIGMDIEGQEELQHPTVAFDNVNIDGEFGRGPQGDREVAAQGLGNVVNQILGNLAGTKTQGMQVGLVDTNAEVFQIFVPGAMTAPIYLSVEEGSSEMREAFKAVTQDIYNAANSGRVLQPSDLEAAMGRDYLKQAQYHEQMGTIWNDGAGDVSGRDTGASQTTLPNTGNY